ncbi:MAG: DedA family protein [Verrucomicrobiota bacterium]|jgi:membrane protein DedA with SNARE-associated domain
MMRRRQMKETITHLIQWYQNTLDSGGYPLIAVLMAIESTLVPIPSELIIPFAAQRAHASGRLSVPWIVVAGALGSWAGATIMYWASRAAGRPLVLRYGGYFMVPAAKLHAAERWAARFGPLGVFVARLLPVVRHLIGIPMGIVQMDFKLYSFFTLAGSALWCAVLAWVGVAAGNDQKLLQGDLHRVTLWLAGAVVVIGLLYYFLVHRFMKEDRRAKEL